MKKLIYIFGLLACLASCSDDFHLFGGEDGEIQTGEKVMFTTSVPKPVAVTRALNTELLKGYTTIADEYELTITMLEGNNAQVGSAKYVPVSDKEKDVTPVTYDSDGTLEPKAGAIPLLWKTNTEKYAFEATAGSESVNTNQTTPENWLAQDRLHGYAFSPFEPENGEPADRLDAPNYHTSKEWYQLNKAWHDAEGQMLASDDYKKIPLFLQHERAWITVILKAGKGVKREAVAALYDEDTKTYNPNVNANIFSYPVGGGTPVEIDGSIDNMGPLKGKKRVYYKSDVNGDEEYIDNMKFDAIVEPHNYLEKPKDDKIVAINLSNMHFSFFASNDKDFNLYSSGDKENLTGEAKRVAEAYNLTAGKHLTIEATLSTDRIVFITAWIEDWTEVVTSTICDDYGQNGDPTVIKSRAELLAFLNDEDLNRAGNVAIIAATELDLDKMVTPGEKEGDPAIITDDPWKNHNTGTAEKPFQLNATLNLAGATLKTSGRLVESISSTGNLIQGTIVMNNATALPSAIAETNDGTIDNISVIVGNAKASATRAGFVEMNHGYILNCSSSLPVIAGDESSDTFIGGIAAQSIAPDQNTSPTIDHCTMYATVKGGTNVKGGGIVGLGEGRLTNNTFDYGITLLQTVANFKNIIHTKDTKDFLNTLTVSGNSWPTLAENPDAGENAFNARYHNVLDCQEELDKLLDPQYNKIDYRYRIANSFTVMAESWNHALTTEDITLQGTDCGGNLHCELDGNGKTISLYTNGDTKVSIPTEFNDDRTGKTFVQKETAHMLFSNITGYVHDLTLEVEKPLIATPTENEQGKYISTEAIAALAYAVRQPATLGTEGSKGNYGVIRNVNVKIARDAYVQAANAAGLVCWVHHNGVVDNCNVKGAILSWAPDNRGGATNDAKRYVGGVVATAAKATIKNCAYYVYSDPEWKTLDIAEHSGKDNTFYGGILGGTTVQGTQSNQETPAVSIIDCASWYQATFNESDTEELEKKRHHGAILGYSYYTENNNSSIGTVAPDAPIGGCQGNWWQADMNGIAPIGVLNGYTVETTIGKRNAVMPTEVNF